MAPGTPKIDNTPLDPGGQTPGQVDPVGAPAGTTAGAAPPAPPEAGVRVPQSEDFLPSLGIDPRELLGPLSGMPPPQEAPKAPKKRLQDHSPDGLGRAPMKSLFGPGHRGFEQALLEHLIDGRNTISTEITAIKAYITPLIEGLEQRLTSRLDAIESRFSALEAWTTTQNTLKPPPKAPIALGGAQAPQQPLPSQEMTFSEVVHGPLAYPNRGTKPVEPRRASPLISEPPLRTKPVAQATGKPTIKPQWADIAANNTQDWQIVTKRRPFPPNKLPGVQADPGSLKPIRGATKGDRRLIFRRENGRTAPKKPKADVILQLNRYLAQAGFPSFVRVVDANYTESGAISALLDQGSTTNTLLPVYKDPLVAACHRVDPAVISVEPDQQWHKIKVHAVPVARYSVLGLGLAREEIELGGTCTLMRDPTWIKPLGAIQATGQRFSTIVVTVGGLDDARKLLTQGVRFGGDRHPTTPYHEVSKDSVCPRCCGIGHRSYRRCGTRPPLCTVCAGAHEAREHVCNVLDCKAPTGHPCLHILTKCGNCGGEHQADSPGCPKLKEARKRLHKKLPTVQVVMPPPPRESGPRETWESLPKGPLEAQEAPQAPEPKEAVDAMDQGADSSSPLPYSSPCPSQTPGAAGPINVDYSA
jgi:hypothetical protein